MYTNQEDVLVCQSCKLSMPFKLPGGDYYFEAVECVGELSQEHPENFLALCPICSAKYRFARKESNDAVCKRVLSSKRLEISLTLAGQASTIRFVEVYLEDLRTVLELEDTGQGSA